MGLIRAPFGPFSVRARIANHFIVSGDSMKAHGSPLDTIECPNCGHVIPVSEALSHQIAERARAESRAEIAKLQDSLARKEQDVKERESNIDLVVEERVAARAAAIEQEAREKARGSVSVEMD